MIHNSKTTPRHVQLVTSLCIVVAAQPAFADASVATNCDVHAAAATPMGAQEVSLVRETARKSCLAQYGGSAGTAVAARAKSDNSFFGTLAAVFSGPTERKPGNQRLLDCAQH